MARAVAVIAKDRSVATKIYWDGEAKNIVGPRVRAIRKSIKPRMTQQQLAERLQLIGYDIDRVTVNRIENGTRFVPDYEVKALAAVLSTSPNDLLGCDCLCEGRLPERS